MNQVAKLDLNTNYKNIRNTIRNKFYAPDLINYCLAEIARFETSTSETTRVEYLRRQPPYYLMLIIEIAIKEGSWTQPKDAAKTTIFSNEIHKLINKCHRLGESKELDVERINATSRESEVIIYLRRLVYQQFGCQKTNLDKNIIPRLLILFDDLEENSTLNIQFSNNHLINIKKFFYY